MVDFWGFLGFPGGIPGGGPPPSGGGVFGDFRGFQGFRGVDFPRVPVFSSSADPVGNLKRGGPARGKNLVTHLSLGEIGG